MSVEPLSFSDDGGSDLGERGIRIAATPNAVSCSDSDLEHRGCTLPGDVGSSSDSDLGPLGCVGLLGARGDDIATRPASNPDVAVDGAPEVAANLDAHAVAIVPTQHPSRRLGSFADDEELPQQSDRGDGGFCHR